MALSNPQFHSTFHSSFSFGVKKSHMASLRRTTFAGLGPGETIFSDPLSKGEPTINQNK